MAGDEKSTRKKRRLLGVLFSLVSLAILTYIAIVLITGRELGFPALSEIFRPRLPVEAADNFFFETGRDRVFAELDGSIASVGSLGLQIMDESGKETLRDPFRMSFPAVNLSSGKVIAFDIGGTAIRVFDKSHVIVSLEATGSVVSASINKNGWFCVCTQEEGAFRSIITAYDNKGRNVYKVSLSSGYALSADLSADNKRLVVLNLTDDGSRITFYDLDKENVAGTFDLPGELILELRYRNGKVLAVTQNALIAAEPDGSYAELYSYAGRRLGGYILGEDFITLHLLDYGVGYRGRLVTLGVSGRLLGERDTDREIISMSCAGMNLAVLQNDGLTLLSSELNEYTPLTDSASAAGATFALALKDGAGLCALAASDHSAVIFRFERSADH